MNDQLTKSNVLVLSRNWQAIGVKTPMEAPRVPREVPVTLLIKNTYRVREWEMFLSE